MLKGGESGFLDIPKDFRWVRPWQPLNEKARPLYGKAFDAREGEISDLIVEELKSELHSDHPLYGSNFFAIGYCTTDVDDVLLLTSRQDMPIVCVHLTWKKERSQHWPHFDVYRDFGEWAAQMKREG